MGTRGAMCFRINGKLLAQYNQFDTYPRGLGRVVGAFIEGVVGGESDIKRLSQVAEPDPVAARIDAMRKKVAALRVVSEDDCPLLEEVERYRKLSGISGVPGTWYSVLRLCQGEPGLVVKVGIIATIPAEDFRSQEYAYVMDFDKEVVEAYGHSGHLGTFDFRHPNLADTLAGLKDS